MKKMKQYQQLDCYGQGKAIEQLDKIFSGHTVTYTQHITDSGTVDIEMDINGNCTYFIEVKDRWYDHNRFSTWYLEADKYNELIKRGGKAYYLNTFKDDWCVVWDLTKMDMSQVQTGKEYLWHSTVEKDYKVWKDVYYLPTEKAVYNSAFI